MKAIVVLLCFIASASSLMGYHHQFLTLQTAEQLFFRQAVIGISHRFLAQPLANQGLLGQDLGAHVGLFVRGGLGKHQVLGLAQSSLYAQTNLFYKKSFYYKDNQWFGLVANVDKLQLTDSKDLTSSFTGFYAWRHESIDMVINTIYKNFFNSMQLGVGVSWRAIQRVKISYEVLSPIKQYGGVPIHVLGSKVMTFGHNFYLFISNENKVGYIPSSSGADSSNVYAGFKIERIFDV